MFAAAISRRIEQTTAVSIRRLVRTIRRYRTTQIRTGAR